MMNQQVFEQLNSILFKQKFENQIKNMYPTQKNLEFKFIILKKIETQITKTYKKITKYWIADETGSAFLNLHDMDESAISPGDVCVMVGAYTNLFKGMMNIHQGKNGIFKKVSEFDLQYLTQPNHSLKNWGNDQQTTQI
ncbi:unnamed protein product [Paramecium pentaurelia]|uniref:Uncharacterized protein n=1 Tax=Paramecium pentaurelia TaxID=43138 RepID=A0A8S1UZC4_9CILI|nr:unnamed protein product [Paramecium pentaurelia]